MPCFLVKVTISKIETTILLIYSPILKTSGIIRWGTFDDESIWATILLFITYYLTRLFSLIIPLPLQINKQYAVRNIILPRIAYLIIH
jgi:hypothetical protein